MVHSLKSKNDHFAKTGSGQNIGTFKKSTVFLQRAEQPFPYWRNTQRLPGAVDINCRAGDAIVFNNCNYHAGTVRQTPHHQRSFGFDYGHAELTPPSHGTARNANTPFSFKKNMSFNSSMKPRS